MDLKTWMTSYLVRGIDQVPVNCSLRATTRIGIQKQNKLLS